METELLIYAVTLVIPSCVSQDILKFYFLLLTSQQHNKWRKVTSLLSPHLETRERCAFT